MTTAELRTAIKNLDNGIKNMPEDEIVKVSKKVIVSILENYKELLKYKEGKM